jgi:hypothetical protein
LKGLVTPIVDTFERRSQDGTRTGGEAAGEIPAGSTGDAMDWQEIGPYRDAVIWVRELRAGCWMAAATPLAVPPASMPGFASPSGEMVLPEEFESQTAAVEAAKRYLNREQERRVRGQESPEDEARTRPTRRVTRRRRFVRVPVCLPVIGRAPQFQDMALHGTVRSVGPGGLMVEFPVAVVRGSMVRLALQTGLGTLEVEGRVAWTANNGDTIRHGLAFPEPKGLDLTTELYVAEGQEDGGRLS